jgi:type II secretory pathway component GspD/PulD (secretin)
MPAMSYSAALRFIVLCLFAATAAAQSLVVLDLKYRTADEIIPVLQPLLEKGGALSGQDYKLFVRTSNANLAQIRAALAQLDRQQRQLLVSVRRSSQQEIERESVSASGTVRAGNGSVGSDVSVRASQRNLQTQGASVSSVQVIEGNSAFIATGTSVPLVTAVAARGGRRPSVAAEIEYRDLERGFMVTPRIANDQVVLEISQRDERLGNGGVETQRLDTQISGPLGQWIKLGGVSASSSSNNSGILSRSYSTGSDELSVWVKVEAQ